LLIFQFLIIHPTFLIIGLTVIVLGRLPFPTVTILSGFRNGTLSTTLSRIAANGGAAWRRRGEHYRSLEPQTVKFPDAVSQSYTPACAKPLVVGWHLSLF